MVRSLKPSTIKEMRTSLDYIKVDVADTEEALDRRDKISVKFYAEDLKEWADELIDSLKKDG